ncbi:MAG: GlsB/YeaQ/YmgE family stress response membrane protein [Patescibacteria group bacterium]
MSWLLAIVVGGVVGWLYSYAVRPERRIIWADIVAGAVGGLLGVWFFANLLGIGFPLTTAVGTFTLLGMIWAIVGSIIVAAIVQALIPERSVQTGRAYYEETERRRKDEEDRLHRR